jgi:hypothetical protein
MLAVMAAASCLAADRALAQDRLVHQATDPATGAVARLFQTSAGPRLEVESSDITLGKQVSDGRVVTTLRHGRQSLVIEADASALSVSGSGGRAVARPGDEAGMRRARQIVAHSPLTARAVSLIARMGFGDASALQPLLLTTRALLLSASEDESGTMELREWVRRLRQRARVVKISEEQRTPTECWKAYGDELLAAYDDFVDCINNIKWWDPFVPVQRCEVIYEVRIVGAFAWYASCVSLGQIGK